jgi:hypothetical protein
MTTKKNYDIACIGNYTKDTIVSPAGTRYVDGGAVNYAAHAVARMDLDVAVVTHLAEEDRRVIDRLARGIWRRLLRRIHPTFHFVETGISNPKYRSTKFKHHCDSRGYHI